jgi:hypothetical protein
VSDAAGVLTVPPPASIMETATRLVTEAAAQLGPDARGGFFPVLTTKGANAAIVQKAGDHVKVVAWIGKVWGQPLEAGGAGVIEW